MNVIDLLDDLTHPQPCCLECLTSRLDVDNPRLLQIIITVIIIILMKRGLFHVLICTNTDLLHSVPAALNDHAEANTGNRHLDPLLAGSGKPVLAGSGKLVIIDLLLALDVGRCRPGLKRTFIRM